MPALRLSQLRVPNENVPPKKRLTRSEHHALSGTENLASDKPVPLPAVIQSKRAFGVNSSTHTGDDRRAKVDSDPLVSKEVEFVPTGRQGGIAVGQADHDGLQMSQY